MILSVTYASPTPSQAVVITMQDGKEWTTDASLPPDTEIRRALADWLAAGNTIAPYVAPTAPVPASVSPLQARRALRQFGLLATVEAAVVAASDEVREAWEYAVEVRRDDPMLATVAAQQGLTDEQLDEMFRLAVTL